jgi:hypothetical protein
MAQSGSPARHVLLLADHSVHTRGGARRPSAARARRAAHAPHGLVHALGGSRAGPGRARRARARLGVCHAVDECASRAGDVRAAR